MPDIVTTRVFSDGEKGITATKMNDIIGSSTIQTSFVSSKPVASSTTAGDNLLLLKSGGTYAQIDSSVFASAMVPLLPDPNPKIWSARLRSFNAIGNPTFEVDQKNIGGLLTNMANGGPILDRWNWNKLGTHTANGILVTPGFTLPGTNFLLSRSAFQITLTGQEASLASGDIMGFYQVIEGPRWRELSLDVHSLSLLVSTSVAGLKFSVALYDPGLSRSLVKLCTIPSANTPTLIQLPNLPVWAAGGNFSMVPGVLGYGLRIVLAAGSTLIAPAADVWQTGSYYGAPGMDNFASKPVNSTFTIGFIQHEPGAVCSTPMDCPFTQNYDDCLRYWCKSYPYATKQGTVSSEGYEVWTNLESGTQLRGPTKFPKRMAKAPNATINNIWAYDGTAGGVTLQPVGTNWGMATIVTNECGIAYMSTGSALPATNARWSLFHYIADTGW